MKFLLNIPRKLLNFAKGHKIWSVAIVVLIVFIGFLLRPKPPKPIETEKVTSGEIVQTVSITGSVAAENMADLSFSSAGKLAYLPFKEGDSVSQWQVIASLDQADLQANLRQAEQDFNAAKAASEQLYNAQGFPTNETFDQKAARTAVDAAQNKAYDNVVKARKAIVDSSLVAPFDGVLTHEDVKSIGVNVTPANKWTIIDPSTLNFKMEVDEADIAKIKVGEPVNVNLDSYPNETIKLTISKIDLVTHSTSSGGDAYYVYAEFPQNSGDKYRVGMNGNAEIVTARKENVLQISISSIQNDNEVLVKTGQKYKVTKIKTGLENDTSVQITSGLSEGQQVATDPTSVPKNLIIN